MTKLVVKTETGSIYRLDLKDRLWNKNGIGMEKLWVLMSGTSFVFPANDPDNWEKVDYPEVGKHMFVQSRHCWFVSTPVVSIEEVEG